MAGEARAGAVREQQSHPNRASPRAATEDRMGRNEENGWLWGCSMGRGEHRIVGARFGGGARHSGNTEGGILCLWLVCFGACSSDSVWMGEGHGEQQQQCVGGEGCVRGGIGVDWCG